MQVCRQDLPLASYRHRTNGCSGTGGYVHRGSRYPVLAGRYLFGDSCSQTIWSVSAAGAARQKQVLLRDTSMAISAFGQDERGELYAADYAGGRIHRISGG